MPRADCHLRSGGARIAQTRSNPNMLENCKGPSRRKVIKTIGSGAVGALAAPKLFATVGYWLKAGEQAIPRGTTLRGVFSWQFPAIHFGTAP